MATATKTYEYSVRDKQGKLVKGKLEAPNQGALVQRLRGMGYAPLTVKEANSGLSMEIKLPGGNKVGLKDLAVMSRQFATMIDSGLSLMRALSILSDQTESVPLAKVLGEVRTDVEGGAALSTAMAKHTRVFPPLMINMCRAGEVGGFLDKVLLQIAENMEAEVKLRAKIKSAMTYPVVVGIFAVLAVIGMLLFIVPTFAKLFKTLGAKLPAPTQLLVDASNILKLGFPVFIVLFIVGPFQMFVVPFMHAASFGQQQQEATATAQLAAGENNDARTPAASANVTVARSQQLAVSKYPALAVQGSPLNTAFLARYARWRQQGDPRLQQPDWPQVLADDCAAHP